MYTTMLHYFLGAVKNKMSDCMQQKHAAPTEQEEIKQGWNLAYRTSIPDNFPLEMWRKQPVSPVWDNLEG